MIDFIVKQETEQLKAAVEKKVLMIEVSLKLSCGQRWLLD